MSTATGDDDSKQGHSVGELLRRARETRNLSFSAAARAAGVTGRYWSHVEQGFENRHGVQVPTSQPRARTLAHMAHAVGISPIQLAEAGREDASRLLTEMTDDETEQLRRDPLIAAFLDDPAIEDSVKRKVISELADIRAQREQADQRMYEVYRQLSRGTG